ncbi:MAG: hypothetical protein U0M42_00615 [Acutalibacteraceae bacterium]|nr:hypothetical protein [Acutalibacteraceae bacterium]
MDDTLFAYFCFQRRGGGFYWNNKRISLLVSFWQKKPLRTKYLSFPIAVCMGIYSFTSGSFSGVCNEILTVISSL